MEGLQHEFEGRSTETVTLSTIPSNLRVAVTVLVPSVGPFGAHFLGVMSDVFVPVI